jgi:hypothetical protein
MMKQVLLAAYFVLVSCLTYPSILKMELYSSETSVDFQLITKRYIPQDRIPFTNTDLLFNIRPFGFSLLFFYCFFFLVAPFLHFQFSCTALPISQMSLPGPVQFHSTFSLHEREYRTTTKEDIYTYRSGLYK